MIPTSADIGKPAHVTSGKWAWEKGTVLAVYPGDKLVVVKTGPSDSGKPMKGRPTGNVLALDQNEVTRAPTVAEQAVIDTVSDVTVVTEGLSDEELVRLDPQHVSKLSPTYQARYDALMAKEARRKAAKS